MKKLAHSIAAALFLTFAIFTNSATAQSIPANLQPQENWMGAWKSFAGQQADASWILAMDREESTVYLSEDGKQFFLIVKSNAHSPMLDEAEIMDFEGNNSQCKLNWTGEMEYLNLETIHSAYRGMISGQEMTADRIDFIGSDNRPTTVLELRASSTKLVAPSSSVLALFIQMNPESEMALLHRIARSNNQK